MIVTTIAAIVNQLREVYGPFREQKDLKPFDLILLENASYLVDDDRRWRVFVQLKDAIGTAPDVILHAGAEAVAAAIEGGGMKAEMRADKVLDCARIAKEIGVAKLNAAVKSGDPSAKRLLRRFPGIGEPSADKIMLLCGGVASVAPDSNALRVLARLGFVAEVKSYSAMYRAAGEATKSLTIEDARAAHHLLRKHGQEVCKRSAPRCEICAIRDSCAWYSSSKRMSLRA